MVKQTLLIYPLLALAPSVGTWTGTDWSESRAPCPNEADYQSAPLRLPRGCMVERAGVWTAPAAWRDERGELAELKSRLEHETARANEAAARATEAERALRSAHETHTAQLEGLSKICTPAPPPECPTWSRRAEGAALTIAACAAYTLGARQ